MRLRGIGCVATVVALLGARAASAHDLMPPQEPPPPYSEQPYGEPQYEAPPYNPPPYNPPRCNSPAPPQPAYHPRRYAGAYARENVPRPRVRVPIDVTVTAGYAMATGVPVMGGTLMLAPSPVFGAQVSVGDWYGVHFLAAYMLQNTSLELQPGGAGGNQSLFDVTAHHFQLGGELDILHGGVRPFLGLSVGAEWLAPHSDVPDELWFEATFAAGAKVRVTRHWGIKAQAQVTGVTMDARSQVFCANGCYTEWYGIGTSQLALMVGPTFGF